MYSRDFGGIKSDGQLYNMEQELKHSRESAPCPEPPPTPQRQPQRGFLSGFLRGLSVDDLIILGIGLLLLLDSEEDNDFLVLIIALLLFL